MSQPAQPAWSPVVGDWVAPQADWWQHGIGQVIYLHIHDRRGHWATVVSVNGQRSMFWAHELRPATPEELALAQLAGMDAASL